MSVVDMLRSNSMVEKNDEILLKLSCYITEMPKHERALYFTF